MGNQARKDDAEFPSLELVSLKVWLALFSGAKQIESLVQKNLRGSFSSSMAKFDLLAQLYRTPEGLSMSQLSRLLVVTNGATTCVNGAENPRNSGGIEFSAGRG